MLEGKNIMENHQKIIDFHHLECGDLQGLKMTVKLKEPLLCQLEK